MLHAPCLDNKSTQKKPDQQWFLTGHYKEVLRRAFGVSKSFRMPSKGLDYIAADPVAHGREYATPAASASVEDVDAVIAAVPSATPMISPAIDAAVILRQCGWIIITPPGGGWGDWSCVTSRLGSPPVGKAESFKPK